MKTTIEHSVVRVADDLHSAWLHIAGPSGSTAYHVGHSRYPDMAMTDAIRAAHRIAEILDVAGAEREIVAAGYEGYEAA
ncbi:MAG: hypothetical protein LC676_10810 [Loktanella sp.]|nr:hypothetical protein [Loktanella sp.]